MAPGRITRAPVVASRGRVVLGLAELVQAFCQFRIGERQDSNRVESGVAGAGVAYRERSDWNTRWHLDDGEERIEALKVPSRNRHAQDREGGLGGEHAGQMCRPAGACDDAAKPSACRILGIAKEQVRRAMGRHDPGLVLYTELCQTPGGVLHHVPVGVATHHETDQRLRHLRRSPGSGP